MSVGKTRRQLTIRLSKAQWDWVFRVRNHMESTCGQPISFQKVIGDMLDQVIGVSYSERQARLNSK